MFPVKYPFLKLSQNSAYCISHMATWVQRLPFYDNTNLSTFPKGNFKDPPRNSLPCCKWHFPPTKRNPVLPTLSIHKNSGSRLGTFMKVCTELYFQWAFSALSICKITGLCTMNKHTHTGGRIQDYNQALWIDMLTHIGAVSIWY